MKTNVRRAARRAAERGMTLIEIMVVLVILGMIAAAIGYNVVGQMNDAKVRTATLEVKAIANAVDMYHVKHSKLPDSIDDLVPNELAKIHKDPWQHDYVFVKNGDSNYQVISYGKDGAQGGGDDIIADSSSKTDDGK